MPAETLGSQVTMMKQVLLAVGLALCMMAEMGCSASSRSGEPVLIEPGYSYLRQEPRISAMSEPGPISFDDRVTQRGGKRFE